MSLVWKLEQGETLEAHEVQLLVTLLRLCPLDAFNVGTIEREIVQEVQDSLADC